MPDNETAPEADTSDDITDKLDSAETALEEASTPAKVRSINRIGLGSLALFQLVLAFIAVILLNYLSCTNHKRFDFTIKEDFTLSPKTRNFLASSDITERSLPIKLIAVVKQQSPYYLRLRAQLENYRRFSDNHITIEFIDPVRDKNRLQELATTYQRDLFEETILIDARNTPADSPQAADDSKVDLSKHIRSLPVNSLFIEQIDRYKQKFIAAWRDEDMLTSYILSAVEGTPRRYYFIVDKARIDEKTKGAPAWKTFQQLLLGQNIQLLPLQISSTTSIPEDAEGVAIIGPAYDFDPREIDVLNEYWDRPSSSFFITIDPDAKLQLLRNFLRDYGITPQDNRVISVEGGQTLTAARGYFTQGPIVNQGLAQQATQLDGSSCGLEVMSNNDRLNIRNISPFSLLQANDSWWGESRYTQPNPEFDAREDQGVMPDSPHHTPVHLAAAVVRGRQNDDLTSPLTSRMIVVGNTDFLKPDNMREELNHFVNSGVNWLVGRESLIGIGPKPTYRKKITVQSAHKSFIDQLVLFFLPVSSLFVALVLWNSRRS